MFTLDKREIPLSSAKSNDNGAYLSKGTVTKFYMYNDEGPRTSHKDENGVWYINIRSSKGYRKEIKAITTGPFYVVMYKWADGADQCFNLPRHRNATKPTSSQYYRKYPSLFTKGDNMIEKGLSTEQVYNSIARKGAGTVRIESLFITQFTKHQ